jgi:peptidoglycan-associated lipoprotein
MTLRKASLPLVLLVLVFTTGCPKKPVKQEPPPAIDTRSSAPATDTNTKPAVAPPVDPVEAPVEKSLQDLQKEFEAKGLLGDIYFDYDESNLRDDAKGRLAKNAEFMRSRPEFSFTVEGHCDERGTNEYNIALGQRRAATAVEYIGSLGINASRFKTISYGEERPFCSESSVACWQSNRRARFVITGRN